MGAVQLRMLVATMIVAGCLVIALVAVPAANAEPETCPPICDQIPGTAWIQRESVPLHGVYRWPSLAAVAVPLTGGPATPQFRFEQVCGTAALPQDPRNSAVAARALVTRDHWQLQALILHWRGDTARGGANAAAVFSTALAALRACQLGAPAQSPSVTDEEPTRMAAVISGPVIVHTYLVAHVASSTVSELTLWSSGSDQVPWPVISDAGVLDALTAPLCDAYLGSCP